MPSKRITRHIDRLILDPNIQAFLDNSELMLSSSKIRYAKGGRILFFM